VIGRGEPFSGTGAALRRPAATSAVLRRPAATAGLRAALDRGTGAAAARDRLAATVVALRDAHAPADGEPWTRRFSAEEVLAAEHAAYGLLAEAAARPAAAPA
jgi:hypothetical protein